MNVWGGLLYRACGSDLSARVNFIYRPAWIRPPSGYISDQSDLNVSEQKSFLPLRSRFLYGPRLESLSGPNASVPQDKVTNVIKIDRTEVTASRTTGGSS
jgi:hypothetical protein